MCDSIGQYEVDIAYLVETNTNWKLSSSAASFKSTKKRHWRHSHSITSETAIGWSDIYKLGGTTIINLPPFSSVITTSGSDTYGLDRWSYITTKGQDHNNLTIISVYRVCQTSITNIGPTKNTIQQWKRLEEKHLEDTNIRDLMIIDLANFITTLHN